MHMLGGGGLASPDQGFLRAVQIEQGKRDIKAQRYLGRRKMHGAAIGFQRLGRLTILPQTIALLEPVQH